MSAELPLPTAVEGRLDRWANLLLTREAATPMALFRAAIGVCVIVSLGGVLAHHDVAALWLDPRHGGYAPHSAPWLFGLLGGATPQNVWSALGVTLAAGGLLVLGLGGRFPALVALLGHMALVGLDPDAGGSYDTLISNALWLLVLADSTATLSLDCWLRNRRFTSAATIPAWPRWLALYQLVLMYASTGLQKVSDTWVPFGPLSAVYYVMQQPTWQRFDLSWLADVYPLTRLATLLVWCFEVSSPLLLLAIWLERSSTGRLGAALRRLPYRRIWAGFGLTFHMGIALTLVLGPFPYVAMAFYLALIPGARRR